MLSAFQKIGRSFFGLVVFLAFLEAAGPALAQTQTYVWTNTAGGFWQTAANWKPNQVPVSGANVVITNAGTYTVTNKSSSTMVSLVLGGTTGTQTLDATGVTLTNVSTVNANGAFNWFGGDLEGSLTVLAGGTLTVSNEVDFGYNNYTDGLTNTVALTNYGTVNWVGPIYGWGNGSSHPGNVMIDNAGLWQAVADNEMSLESNPTNLFLNTGTLEKTGGTGTTTILWNFTSTGTINTVTGDFTLTWNGPSVLHGNLTLSASTISAAVSVATNAVLSLTNSCDLESSLTVLQGGTLTTSNEFDFGYNNYTDGLTNTAALTNYGTVIWAGPIYGWGNGTAHPGNVMIDNAGVWQAVANNTMNLESNPTNLFVNTGTLEKTGGAGTSTIKWGMIVNGGTISTPSGSFSMGNWFGSGVVYGSAILSGGTISGTLAPGDTMTFTGTTINDTLTVSANAVANWFGGDVEGSVTILAGGALTMSNEVDFGYNNYTDSLTNTVGLTNYGTVIWAGSIYGWGNGTVHPGSVMIDNAGLWQSVADNGTTIESNPSTLFLNTGTLEKTSGTGTTSINWNFTSTGTISTPSGAFILNWDGPSVLHGNLTLSESAISAAVAVATNAVLNLKSSCDLESSLTVLQGGMLTMSNEFDFGYNNYGDDLTNTVALTNYGTVIGAGSIYGWGNGTAHPGGVLIDNAGLWQLVTDNGMTLESNPTNLVINTGTLEKIGGTGTSAIAWNLNNSGGVLGAQTGTMSLTGGYNLAGGTLNCGISNLTSFGVIHLAGNPAVLTGTISANLNGGYVPAVSNAFPVITFNASSGSFTNTSLPAAATWATEYNAANVTLLVVKQGGGKQTPDITWANPGAVTYGTALGSQQLDASANVAGSFAYSPAVGTILSAGAQTLSVVFTPTDTTDYSSVTNTVSLVVSRAPLTVTAYDLSKAYGQTLTFGSGSVLFTSTGLQNRETIGSVTLTISGNGGAASAAAGNYTITPSAATGGTFSPGNYVITYVNGVLTVTPASAQSFSTLYNFTNGVDGGEPFGALLLAGGTLYGTTIHGGGLGDGAVFAINTNGTGLTNLHSFNGSDGTDLQSGLVLSGNTLYGTTFGGGSSSQGTLFAINTNGTGFRTLYNFTNGSDGANPNSGLFATGGKLFGTAYAGGRSGAGTVFSVNADGTGFATLYAFTNGTDGANPCGALILSGNRLYGTALKGVGAVFGINTDGTGFAVLHTFNGAAPFAGLMLAGGTLYGTTEEGGNSNDGAVFAVSTNGTGFTNLFSFDDSNGEAPSAGLVLSGNTLFGTCEFGGDSGDGTVFAVNTNGTGFTNLLSFDQSDGYQPVFAVLLAGGTLYGTTISGGTSDQGTVFALPLPAANTTKPVLAWNAPAAIPYGTPLGSAQLDATANVPGTFAYEPASGSLFNAGTTTLSVVFTPSYPYASTSLSSKVSLVVSPAPLTVRADNQTKVYGETLKFGSGSTLFTSSGLQNGDTIGSVTLAVSGNGGAATAPISASPYTITPSAAIGGTFMTKNYAITYLTGLLAFTSLSGSAQSLAFTSTNLTVGSGAAMIVPVDINRDGHLGLVCANFGFSFISYFGGGGGGGNTLSVFTNDGHGNLYSNATLTVGKEPSGLATADVNGDGWPDLISANVGDNTLTVLTNNGKGRFIRSGTFPVGRGPSFVTTADVNGDGKVDLISANFQGNSLTILTNDGHGGFASNSTIAAGSEPNCVAAVDINGDGKVDLVCANVGDSTLQTFINNGQGVFTATATIKIAGGAQWVVGADVDGNGSMDLAVVAPSTLTVLTNNGSGVFNLKSTAFSQSCQMVVAAEMNGDGKVDLICNNNDGAPGSATVLTNDGNGNFTASATLPVGLAGNDNYPNFVAAADFNNDGNMDFAVSCFGTATVTELTQTNAAPKPIVAITAPANDSVLTTTSSFVIDTTVQSSNAIDAVFYLLGTNTLGASTSPPYNMQVPAGSIAAGSYSLQAAALDSAGNIGWSPVTQINVMGKTTTLPPPTATITGFGGSGTGWTLNGSPINGPPTIANNVLTIVNGYNSATSAFYNTRQGVTSFTVSFVWQNTIPLNYAGNSSNPADGMVFTLQNQGLTAVGGSGSGLGYEGIAPATGVAFNLYGGQAHVVGVGYAPDSTGNGSFFYYATGAVNFDSTDPMAVVITYYAATSNFSLSVVDTVTHAVFVTNKIVDLAAALGGSTAYMGFTGGSATGESIQTIRDFTFTPLDHTAGAPPSVSIASPANGASFLTSQSLIVKATASSAKEVDLYVDGRLLQTATSSPYNFSIPAGSLSVGNHALQVLAEASGGAVGSSPVVLVTLNTPGTALIDFDALDTSAGAVGGTALAAYLAQYGVTMNNVTAGTVLEAVNTNSLTGTVQVTVPSAPNFFTQAGLNQPVSFTLSFATPIQSFGFTRAGLTVSSGQASHPQWTATILDSNGNPLGSVSEALITSSQAVAARSFVLTGTNIASVRFDSDSQGIAAFSAVLLDNLVLNYNPTAPELAVALSVVSPSVNAIVAPATITLGANVTDQLSSSYTVSFYAGPNLLGTASGSPYQITVPNLLSGNYSLQARVTDASGVAALSAVVPINVQLGPNSSVVNFEGLNTSAATVTGTTLAKYLASHGVTVSSLSAGTALTVDRQQHIAGGKAVLASSGTNLLTQTGGNGPVQFTLGFAPFLSQFGFTRPELLANPFVSHPAWQVIAFDGAANVVGQVGEAEIDSSTNVGASQFSLGQPGGPGIAKVEFASAGSGLTTFNAMLVDDLVLTTNTSATPAPPSVAITAPASGLVLAAPPAVTISAAAASAAGIARVVFFANGVSIGRSTTSPYSIQWTDFTAGNYALTAVAEDNLGDLQTSSSVNITIQPSAYQFGLASQPASQTVAAGGSVTFSVAATGTNAVSYQWSHNKTPIPGAVNPSATSATLILPPPLQDSDAGTYTVAVTAPGETLASDPAFLTVVDPPVITTQPAAQTLPAGSTIVLNVAATSGGAVTYQWLLNGTRIPGATNNAYLVPAAQPLNSGKYQVAVANLAASTNSAVAPVIVQTAITIPPTNNSLASSVAINPLLGPVAASNAFAILQAGAPLPDNLPGGNTIWFNWRSTFTGTISLTTQGSDFDTIMAVYTGATLKNLKVVAADDDSGGFLTSLVTFNVVKGTNYQIAVDGFQGASGRVVLGLPSGTGYRILNPSSGTGVPVIVKGPASEAVAPNAKVTLSVTATSATKMTYQWYFQGTPIPGATGSTLVIPQLRPALVGLYDVLVANAAGSSQSEPANLQIASNQGGTTTSTGNKFITHPAAPASLAIDVRPLALGGDSRGFSVSQVFSTVGAVSEPGEPQPCGQVGTGAQWFVYTAPAAGLMTIGASGSTFNTIIGVYTGTGASFATLNEAGCGYTTNYLTEGQPIVVIPGVVKGATYYILVAGFQGASGVAQLQIGLGQPLSFSALPASKLITAGSNVTFTVTNQGSTASSYQWQLNGANVAGGTKASYTVTNAQAGAVGNYTVIVSNVVGAVTSSPPAALTLQYAPLILAGPTNESLTVGQAAKLAVTAIGVNVKTNRLTGQWYFNGAPILKATNLVFSIPKVSLTNNGEFYIILSNSYGTLTSTSATLTVVAKVQPALAGTLAQTGGDFSSGATDTMLTAPPGSVIFTVAAETLSAAAGTYSGLFYPTNGATEAASGFFTATLSGVSPGAFSGNILLDGGSYAFSGQFDPNGNAVAVVPLAGQSSVTASLSLNLNSPDGQMTGVISNANWASVLQAGLAATNLAPDSAVQFTLMTPSGNGSLFGYLTVTNAAAGTALVTGSLADGSYIIRTAPVDVGGVIPLYAPLYSGQGFFLGWITLTNAPGSTNFGQAVWFQPGATNGTSVNLVK